MTTNKKKFYYRFKKWTVDPISCELYKGKHKQNIQSKMLEVLISLIEANGQLVTKEEIQDRVWKNTIVTENSLNKSISELRKILSDAEAKLIETVPGKGYRIKGTFKKVEYTSKKIKIINHKPFAAILISILAIIFTLTQLIPSQSKKALSLSPDGTKVAYFINDSSSYSLIVENIESKGIMTIVSIKQPESFALNWSPDNNKIVYNASESNHPFYSINIISLNNLKTTYIKFARDTTQHELKSVPKNIDSNLIMVNHREFSLNDQMIHHIYLNIRDTIKVFFEQGKIKSFSW